MELFNAVQIENRNYMISERKHRLFMANLERIGPDGFMKAADRATTFRLIRLAFGPREIPLAIVLEWGGQAIDWADRPYFETIAECSSLDIANAMYDKTASGTSVS